MLIIGIFLFFMLIVGIFITSEMIPFIPNLLKIKFLSTENGFGIYHIGFYIFQHDHVVFLL